MGLLLATVMVPLPGRALGPLPIADAVRENFTDYLLNISLQIINLGANLLNQGDHDACPYDHHRLCYRPVLRYS